MKRIFLSLLAVSLLAVSCQNEQVETIQEQEELSIDMTNFYVYTDDDQTKAHGHTCGSMKVLNRQLKENPGLEKRMYDVEFHTKSYCFKI